MQILRHSQIAVTMDIYSQVTSSTTRAALTRLGGRLASGSGMTQLLQVACERPFSAMEKGL